MLAVSHRRLAGPQLLAVLLATVFLAGLTLTGSIAPAHAANGTLSGTVTEVGTGVPLGSVTVEAFCWQVAGSDPGEVCGTTHTTANGTYSLSLAPGVYKVSFDDVPDHARQFYGGGTDLGDVSSTEISVPSGGSATGIDGVLQPLRTVSGTVTGTGTPIGGINVTAYELSSGPSPSWDPVTSVVTESDGTYSMHIPDGAFRVGFADAHGPYRTVFYDGATTLDQADDVVIAGADITGIDADMARNHAITGAVTVDGVDMPGVIVTAYQTDASAPSGWEAVEFTQTGADGRYALYLDDGSYRIEFTTWQARFDTVYYPGVSSIGQATDVVVAGAEVPGISAAIVSGDVDTGPAIRGTIVLADGGVPVAGVYVTAWRFDEGIDSWVQVRTRPTMPDGTYALYVPEGTYRVGVADFVNRYQTAFYEDATTVDDATDVVQPTEGVTGIDIEVVENPSISGQVTADPLADLPPGPPPTLVTAWRWDAPALEWVRASEAGIAPDGHYELYVPDGTYRIEFTTFSTGYQQPHFYDGADNIGEASDVVLDGADVTGVDAHLVAASDELPPTWLSTSTLSTAGQDGWDPRVAVDPQGHALAVWSQRGDGDSRVQASRKTGAWNQPFFLSPAGEDASDARVAAGVDGTFVVVWRRWDGNHYRVEARTRSATGTWSSPITLSGPDADAWDPEVAVGHDRSAVVVWRSSDAAGSEIRARTLGVSGRWSAAVTLSADRDAWDPQVAVAADGAGVVVWSRSGRSHQQVQAIWLSKERVWSRRTNLSAPGRDADDPQVAIAPGGAATVVWRSSGANERIQAARRAPGRGWSEPTNLSTADRDAYDPQVAMNPGGTVTAVWNRWDGSSNRVQASTRIPRGNWSTPQTLSRGGEDATAPQVAVGPDGKATVIWHQADSGGDYVLASISHPGWTWSAPTVLGSGLTVYGPRVAVGADGTLAAVWERRIDGRARVQGAVRFDPGGPDHCRNVFGVDINIVFGVPEQFVDGPCRTVNARSRWRPLTLWIMNTAFEQVPPDFVPAGATPLEDLIAKLEAITVVIDAGTATEKTVVFSPTEALGTDRTFADYDPSAAPLPMAASLPRMGRLPTGKHTVTIFWTLLEQHCDGFGVVEAQNCLASGNVRMWTREMRVRAR